MIKIVFFDIDGTLVPMGKDTIPEDTLKVLKAMQRKGIKVIVATGRPPNSIDHIKKLFDFDGYLTSNGQYCFDCERVIYEKYIPQSSIQSIIPYIEENHLSVLFATIEQCYRNQYNVEDFDARWPIVDLNSVADQKIVQVMTYIHPQEDEAFLKHIPHCKSTRWSDKFSDIIPTEGGKDYGIDQMIKYFGISLADTMAFGDGGNDIPMLKHVAYGVAMGNASDQVKQHADYITKASDEGGILHACLHFGILDENDIESMEKIVN